MSKQLTVSETPIANMNMNIIGDEQQYIDHLQSVQPTDVTFLIENSLQYVQPVNDEIILNKFPSQGAFDSQVSNLTWSDVSAIYEDNDFVDKSDMFVYFYDYDGSIAYQYNIDEFFMLDELPPLPDHSDINKICYEWNWTLQEIRDYLEDCPADINVGCSVRCGNHPELGSSYVRFFAHSGNLLYEYTAAQFLALGSLPALPDLSSMNRVADGWNWTFAQISDHLHNVDGDVNVGYTISPGNNPSVGFSKVRFIDYEGTVLYEYTAAQFLALSALPALPDRTSENLTCDEWNWTLSEITSYLNTVDGDVNVGAIYHTTDDKTHITCKPTETYPQAAVCLTPTVANAVTVDWGDGTTDTWTSASQATKSHTYTGVTNSSVYDISISCSSGTYKFQSLITGSQNTNANCVYTDIKLSNKVTYFNSTFQSCYCLKTINIPNSVTYISTSCFPSCRLLQAINIPSSVTYCGYSVFSQCYSLKFATIPNNFTEIGGQFFYNCYSLQSITIPSGSTSLGYNCFLFCYSLQSITIPSSVTSISSQCFRYCTSLKYINIPSNVTSIGAMCFGDLHDLPYITIPSGVTSLGGQLFQNCYSLQCLAIPSGVTNLGDGCFHGCHSLKFITIPSGVTSMGIQCFRECASLQTIEIPNSVTSFGEYFFYGCESLQYLAIPSGATSFGSRCFSNCYSLQHITIPRGATSFGEYCFNNCDRLLSIAIPNSITSFENYCFSGCIRLARITIPSNVTSLGQNCFNNCIIQHITIPSSVISIGEYCFNCTFLKIIYMKSITPPTISTSTAIINNNYLTIYVPTGSLTTYQSASNWSAHSSKIKEYNNLVKNTQITNLTTQKNILFNTITSYSLLEKYICVQNDTENNVNDINFYDYDDKLLYSYSNTEFLSLNSLPALPDRTSENLTCDGWNWTLQQIKNQINNVGGVVNVGAIYHTTDDKTHITCKPTETFSQASICLTPTVANAVTIDWGDGSAVETWTSTSQATKSHTYTSITNSSVYDITISCSSGAYMFETYFSGSQNTNANCVYTDIKLSNKVTRLGNYCFSRFYYLQSIVIPNSVVYFGGYCFRECYSLKFIIIPSSVTSTIDISYCISLKRIIIHGGATTLNMYSYNISLKSVTIPNGTTSLRSNSYCYSLQSVTIPNSVTELSTSCFGQCTSLKSIDIPNNVLYLGDSCFSGCSLQSITIPNSVTTLAQSCFANCRYIKSITIPSSVTDLRAGIFSGCFSLNSITIQSNVTSLGNSFFNSCHSLPQITIPNNVTSIGDACFQECFSLKSINIPSGVTSMGNSCFLSCYNLQSINIPIGVTSLNDQCFQNCYSLQSIEIPSGVTSIGSQCFHGCHSLQSIELPSGVTSMGNSCFTQCYSLQTINIPSSVTSIGSQCFAGCDSLQSIELPSGVTSLGQGCFTQCYSLQSIEIPSDVTSLGQYCFTQCYSLQSIEIPSDVTSLGQYCFSSCTALNKIYMGPTTPPTLENTNAIPSNTNLVIYVPTGSLSAYQSASNWSTFASKMKEL